VLRVRVELIPHGCFEMAETLDVVYITNDGSGTSSGPNEGGIGNYNVTRAPKPAEGDNSLGRIEGVPRSPKHRLGLAIRALQMLRQGDKPRKVGL
jgi:hypothetical protein